jgi:hypothetical protein
MRSATGRAEATRARHVPGAHGIIQPTPGVTARLSLALPINSSSTIVAATQIILFLLQTIGRVDLAATDSGTEK